MPLSALLECEAPSTVAASGAPFRFSYATARTVADDPILQLWKGPTSSGSNKVFEIDKDGDVNTGVWKGTAIASDYGGTGVDGSAAANGRLLIGNGSGYTLAALTAGAGISVTNGAGSITIANTDAGPLGETFYNPGSVTETAAPTGGSFGDVDSTNLTVSFTAPASGEVIVFLSACYNNNAAADRALEWNLRDGSGDITGTGMYLMFSSLVVARITVPIRVTGLTGGNAYTWKWGHRANGANMNTSYGSVRGQASMIVLGS